MIQRLAPQHLLISEWFGKFERFGCGREIGAGLPHDLEDSSQGCPIDWICLLAPFALGRHSVLILPAIPSPKHRVHPFKKRS